jgi:GAF domain-containing protein
VGDNRTALNRAKAGSKPDRSLRYSTAVSVSRVGALWVVPLLSYLGYRSAVAGHPWQAAIGASLLVLYLGTVFRTWNTHIAHGAMVLIAFYWLAWALFIQLGYVAEVQLLLLVTVVLAVLFYGHVTGLAVLVSDALTLVLMGWLATGGRTDGGVWVPADDRLWLQTWVGKSLVLSVVGGVAVLAIGYLVERLEVSLDESMRRVRELEDRDAVLARKTESLSQRNVVLSRQADAFRAAIQAVCNLSPTLQEDVLLEAVISLIGEECAFDHVGLFLIDSTGEWAELRASSSEGGQRMLSRRHRLRVGSEGIVGLVTAHDEPYVASHVDDDPAYYQNPDLPETTSEMAVPIRNRGTVIGALDIQQAEAGAFGQDDAVAGQALADLIAALLQSHWLFTQLQQSLAVERRAYAEISAQAWLERARLVEERGYRYERGRTRPLGRGESAGDLDTDPPEKLEQFWPLRVRGRLAGRVDARKSPDRGGWTAAEREFMETVIEELGPALESARLHENAQTTAARDRLLADIYARTSETLDLDTVLRTAADEIYAAFDLSDLVIHLVPPGADRSAADESDLC